MDTSFHIKNWLTTAFEEPVDRLNEFYYFDKLNNEFFSIFITDYFLLEDESATNIQSPYSDKEFRILKDRINRIEAKDSSVTYLPRLTVEERKQVIAEFLQQNSKTSEKEKIQLLIDNETGRNLFDISEISDELKPTWKMFKMKRILEKVDGFCNLNRIDIESASLWTEAKVTIISLDLTGPTSKSVDTRIKVDKKSWWKFW
jgi:hypothetical protein